MTGRYQRGDRPHSVPAFGVNTKCTEKDPQADRHRMRGRQEGAPEIPPRLFQTDSGPQKRARGRSQEVRIIQIGLRKARVIAQKSPAEVYEAMKL